MTIESPLDYHAREHMLCTFEIFKDEYYTEDIEAAIKHTAESEYPSIYYAWKIVKTNPRNLPEDIRSARWFARATYKRKK